MGCHTNLLTACCWRLVWTFSSHTNWSSKPQSPAGISSLWCFSLSNADVEPDMLWPNAHEILCSAVSSCTRYISLGLDAALVTVWDRLLGELMYYQSWTIKFLSNSLLCHRKCTFKDTRIQRTAFSKQSPLCDLLLVMVLPCTFTKSSSSCGWCSPFPNSAIHINNSSSWQWAHWTFKFNKESTLKWKWCHYLLIFMSVDTLVKLAGTAQQPSPKQTRTKQRKETFSVELQKGQNI